MQESSFKPVVFSAGKPKPWWQGAAGLSLIVSAMAALVLGIGSYARGSSSSSATGADAAEAAEADAVTRVMVAGKVTKRVWGETLAGDFVAQALVAPSERQIG